MKVLLTHAYFLELDPAERKVMKPYPPLGLLYLSAWLKRAGHEVQVFDGSFLRPEDFTAVFHRFQPDVVGFYANMMTRRNVLRLREAIGDAKVRVAVGGPDPPHYAEEYLRRGFDAVIIGEGERPFERWLAAIDDRAAWRNIEGLAFLEDGVVTRTPPQKPDTPLAAFPMPDRGAIDIDAYLDCWERHHGCRPINLITSRGCPFQCTWCSHNVYGYSLRRREPAAVIAEMEWIHQRYRVDRYWFADDVFTIQYPWIFELRDLLARRPELRRPFECIARADRLRPDIVQALTDMACRRVWVGAESGSQRLLDAMKRGVKRDRVIEAVRGLRAAGVETGMFFMWGFKDEVYADVLATVDLAAACSPDIALTTLAYPIKGTRFHRELADGGRLGAEPDFGSGSDRDIAILGQPGMDVYAHADRLLHATLQEGRYRRKRGPRRLKAWGYRGKRILARRRLRRAFQTYDFSKAASPESFGAASRRDG